MLGAQSVPTKFRWKPLLMVFMRGILCFACASVSAATITWTGGGADNNISTAANWSLLSSPLTGDALIFTGSARTSPLLDTSLSVASITFNSSAAAFTLGGSGTYTVGSGGITNSSANTETINNNITLGAAQTWSATSGNLVVGGDVNNGGYLLTISGSFATSINGSLSGVGGLTKSSTGILTLNGNNSFSGTLTLSAGVLAIGSNTAAGTSTIALGKATIMATGGARTISNTLALNGNTIFSGADDLTFTGAATMVRNRTLIFNNTGIVTFSGVISQSSGSRRITKSGNGTLALNGANTFSGGVVLNAGVLIMGNNAAAGTGTLSLGNATIQAGGAARTLANAITLAGNTIFSGAYDLTFSGATDLAATCTLTISNSTTTFNGDISSAGGITKGGSGTLMLGGGSANLFTGSVIVNDGALVLNKTAGVNAFSGSTLTVGDGAGAAGSALVQFNAASQLPNPVNVTVNTDGQINLQGFTNTVSTLSMTGGSVIGTGTSRLDLGGNVTVSAINSDVAQISANVGLSAARTFTVNDNAVATDSDLTITGVISNGSGTGSLTKAGTGTLFLGAANTYSGGTSINSGRLLLDNASALGSAAVNLGDIAGIDAASLLFSPNSGRTVTNAITVRSGSSGAATLGGLNSSGINTYSGGITLNKAVTLSAAMGGEIDFGGVISGGFGVTVTGGGIIGYNAGNTYSGVTSITDGTLLFGISNAIGGGGGVTISGSTAVFNLGANHTNTVGAVILDVGGSITGSGTSALTSTAAFDLRSGTVNIPLNGTLGLNKSTTGTVTLNSVNGYSGATTISAGALQLGIASSLPASTAVSVASGALLDLGSFNQTIGSLTSAGAVTLGTATLTTGGDNSTTTFSGTINGTGGLTKNGSGIFSLSGTNAYSGATNINTGTLKLGAAGGVNSASALSIASGATFDLNNFSASIGSLAGAGNVTLGSGRLTTGGNNSSTSYSGVISGTGGLTTTGTGTLTLSGSNTFTNSVSVNSGSLTLSGVNGRIASASAITIGTGATLNIDNSAGEQTDRIANSAPISFVGGNLSFISDSNGSTETAGALNAVGGASSITVVHNGVATDSTSLTFSSLGTITAGASVNFSATGGTLGANSTGPRIYITGQANGLMGGWATVGSNFAEYYINGVRAFSNYYTGSLGVNLNDATKIVQLSSSSPSGAFTLTNAGTTTDMGLSLTDLATVDLGAVNTRTLNLVGGGLIKSTATATTISGVGRLTAGGTANGTLAVSVDAGHTLTISAPIINNAGTNGIYGDAGDGVVSLSKADAGLLILSGSNTFSGNVLVNTGTLQVSAENNLGVAGNYVIFGGGTLSVTSGFSASTGKVITVNADLSGTVDIASGQTLTLANASDVLTTGNTASVLRKAGAGSLIIQSANPTFDGVMQINAGVVELRNAQSLGDSVNRGRITLNGGTLKLSNDTSTNFTNDVTVTADSTVNVSRLTGTTPAVSHTLGALSIGAQSLTTTGSNGAALTFGAVTLTGGATFNPTTADLTLGAVTGSVGFTKSGAGSLILNGTSTYTGVTTINAGTLRLGVAGGVSVSSAVVVAGGAWFDLNNLNPSIGSLAGSGNVTLGSGTLTSGGDNSSTSYSGVISGSGGLAKSGVGTFVMSGANSYTGATSINAGVLRLSAGNSLSSSTALSISSGATLDINNFNASIGSLNGSGGVTLGSGTLTTGANNSSTTFSGSISGSGGVTKSGTGALTLSNLNSFSGTFNVTGGIVLVQNNDALGSSVGVTVVASGAELRVASGISITSEPLTLSGTGTSGGGALRLISGTAFLGGGITLAADASIGVDAGQLTLGGTINEGVNALTFTGAGDILSSGSINGSGGVVKNGSGTLTLTAANTYTGTTTINVGAINVQNGDAFGTVGVGAVSVASGAALIFNTASGIRVGNKVLTVSGTGIGGAGVIDSVVGVHSWAGGITLAADATFAVEADSLTLSGAIGESGGARSLTKIGAGTLVFGGANTYSGATRINAGTLQIASSERIGDISAVIIAAGATLDLNDADETIGSLSGAGTVAFGTLITASLTTGADNTSTSFSGVLSGSGDLIKKGAGTQTLSGTSTFTGNVFINSGVLSISADVNLGASTNGLNFGGGTLRLTSAMTISRNINLSIGGTIDTSGVNSTISSAISGPGSFTKIGAGSLSLTAANGYTGDTFVNSGTLSVGASGALASTNVNVSSSATLAVVSGGLLPVNTALNTDGAVNFNSASVTIVSLNGASSGVVTLNSTNLSIGSGSFAGVIQNGASIGGITKADVGTLTLTGTNTYTGGTSINGGTLALGSSGAVGSSGSISFGGGTLQYGAANATDYSSRFSTSASQSYKIDTNGRNVTYGSALNSTGGSLTKSGSGNLTLNASNTYSGATMINMGTLTVNATLTNTASVAVESGATLAGTGTLAGLTTVKSGGFISPGNATTAASVLNFSNGVTFQAASSITLELAANGFASSALNADGTVNTTYINNASNRVANANDRINVTGAINLSSGSTFNVLFSGGNSAHLGDAFDLLDWTTLFNLNGFTYGTGLRSGSAADNAAYDLKLPDISSANLAWNVSNFPTSGIIVVQGVPEPHRAVLILVGCMAMFLRRRR